LAAEKGLVLVEKFTPPDEISPEEAYLMTTMERGEFITPPDGDYCTLPRLTRSKVRRQR
jgi:hypothetical protein